MSLPQQAPASAWAILAASTASSLAFLSCVRGNPSPLRTASKTTATALLAALVASCGGPPVLACALALGALGDAFLAWSEGDGAFLGGLGSFLCAHVLYAKLFSVLGGGVAQIQVEGWRQLLAVAMLLVGPGFNYLLFSNTGPTLRVPVLAYSAVILSMYISALTVDNGLLIAGAVLFTVSDIILATEKFLVSRTSSHRPWMQYAVWMLYYSGQLLIALSVLGQG